MPKMNEGLEFWTADEVAECLNVSNALSVKLWDILSESKNPTPQGGDGSLDSRGRPTVEEPSGQWDSDNDDKAPHWWNKLTDVEQVEINDAFVKEYGDDDDTD